MIFECKRNLATSTKNGYQIAIQSFLSWCITEQHLLLDECRKEIRRYNFQTTAKKDYLCADELPLLLNSCDENYLLHMILCAGNFGMRKNEMIRPCSLLPTLAGGESLDADLVKKPNNLSQLITMKKTLLALALTAGLASFTPNGKAQVFNYTGSLQRVTLQPGTYNFSATGGCGGPGNGQDYGNGGQGGGGTFIYQTTNALVLMVAGGGGGGGGGGSINGHDIGGGTDGGYSFDSGYSGGNQLDNRVNGTDYSGGLGSGGGGGGTISGINPAS